MGFSFISLMAFTLKNGTFYVESMSIYLKIYITNFKLCFF